MSAPVLVMAGGTGGHVFPGLAVAEALRLRDVPVVWLGAEGGMEQRLVPARGIAFESIRIGGIRGKGWKRRLSVPLELLSALLHARRLLRRLQPRSVLSLGGYAAGPGGLAAWWLGRPLLVHEQNSIPGLTNRVLARLAKRVLTGFPSAFKGRSTWVGNPVRRAIAELPPPQQRFAERSGRLHLLVFGGSLGARVLNRTLPAALALLPAAERPEVIHQCGEKLLAEAQAAYTDAGVHAKVVAFIDDMAAAYGWADLAVCRAGALTLAELTAAGLGALLIPYPSAVDDHQTANARWLSDAGAAELIPEHTLTAELLAERLRALASDRAVLLQMAEKARAQARVDAAELVADACVEAGA
jgi:UDP-N-acetylglucosamine--N-acetylmuramyl-(pentapeptide) pyrophosphoryl-undecaprenol N-acetylglucosamine transferase